MVRFHRSMCYRFCSFSIHQHSKFCGNQFKATMNHFENLNQNWSNNCGDIMLFRFFKMPVGCHFEFLNSGILPANRVLRAKKNHCAKFRQNQSNGFKIVAISHLDVFTFLDHPQSIFGGLHWCVKLGWNPCSSFDNMKV